MLMRRKSHHHLCCFSWRPQPTALNLILPQVLLQGLVVAPVELAVLELVAALVVLVPEGPRRPPSVDHPTSTHSKLTTGTRSCGLMERPVTSIHHLNQNQDHAP